MRSASQRNSARIPPLSNSVVKRPPSCLNDAPAAGFATWQAAGKDGSSLVADPEFVAGKPFALQPSSPALTKLGFQPIDTRSEPARSCCYFCCRCFCCRNHVSLLVRIMVRALPALRAVQWLGALNTAPAAARSGRGRWRSGRRAGRSGQRHLAVIITYRTWSRPACCWREYVLVVCLCSESEKETRRDDSWRQCCHGRNIVYTYL